MRTLLVSAMVAAFLVVFTVVVQGGTASADNPPHQSGAGATADSCAGCHRAHTGQADKLLKSAQPALCYSCHGTGAAGSDLNVEDGTSTVGSPSTALKGGGFANARIDTTDASLPSDIGGSTIDVTTAAVSTSAHTVDGSAETVWGGGSSGVGGTGFNLACGTCHDPHGNGNYRVLVPDPGTGSGTSVTDEGTKDYDTTDYFSVSYVAGDDISNWCAECHTRYLAANDNDSGDATFKYRHKSDGTGSKPACIKCHVAHGTNASMGTNSDAVPWPGGAAAVSGENSRLLRMDNRGICQKCHEK